MKKLKYIIAASLLLVLGIAVEHQHTHNSPKQLAVADVHVDTHFNLQELTTFRSGNIINIQLPGDILVQGTVNCVQEYVDGITRFGGSFERGRFCYAINNHQTVSGIVFYDDDVFVLNETPLADVLIYTRKNIDTVMCTQHPDNIMLAAGTVSTVTTSTDSNTTISNIVVTVFSSKPTSINQSYLEFRGLTVQDPVWNGGKPIVATAPNYTVAQITDVYNVVAARYAAFDVNVTTNFDLYNKAKPNTRTRVIFTTNDSWFLNCGGVAYISSFKLAGLGWYTPNVPCWVFTRTFGTSTKNVGEVAAHEAGHTLGLFHDGTSTSTYYYGQGNWGPIMGCAYGKTVVQFSKGEYTGANVKQDDITTVRSTLAMGSLVVAPVTQLNLNAGTFNNIGNIIAESLDIKTYTLPIVSPGTLTITAAPALYSAVDLTLQLLKNGSLVATADPVNVQAATLKASVTGGTYTIRVVPSGNSDTKTVVYSSYGSIGVFTLTGSLTNSGTLK